MVSVSLNLYQLGKDPWIGITTLIQEEMMLLIVESKEYQKLARSDK